MSYKVAPPKNGRPFKKSTGERTQAFLAWLRAQKNGATNGDIHAAGFATVWNGAARARLFRLGIVSKRLNHDERTGAPYYRYRVLRDYKPKRGNPSPRRHYTALERKVRALKAAATMLRAAGFTIIPPAKLKESMK
jgi:hypothetical protein